MKKNLILEIGILAIAFFLYSCSNDSSSGSGENDSIDGDWSHSGNETLYGLTFNSDGSCTGLRVDSTSSYRYYRQTCSWEASDGSLTVSVESCERSEDGKEWMQSSSCDGFTRSYFIDNSILVLYTGDGSDGNDAVEYWIRGRSGILPDDLPQPPFGKLSSSSSEKRSSSSSVKAAWQYLNPEISYGEFTDNRDGQVYKMVKIGTQTWMAENLNYADSTAMPDLTGEIWCYDNIAENCAKYGRLYTWTAAMNIADFYQDTSAVDVISAPHQGVCPSGWHIPTNDEWVTLDGEAGGTLKSISGWHDDGNGTDEYGFSALPALYNYYEGGSFHGAGFRAYFWSATEYDTNYAYIPSLGYEFMGLGMGHYYNKFGAFSVRCILNGSSSSAAKYSSSSRTVSSSSAKVQSSSSVVFSSSSSIKYGSFIYGGQTYKTVTIGAQTWMAENLNYADSTAMPNLKGNSWCYDNSADSCAKYGRLYTWTGAMNIANFYQDTSASSVIFTPHQGVCPSGWHIPTDAEWVTLENAVGGDSTAGSALKSTSGWYDDGNGTDAYGFSALPAGRYSNGNFLYVGDDGYWWTATEYPWFYAEDRDLSYGFTLATNNNNNKNESGYKYYKYSKDTAFSVRCVQD